MKTVVLVRDIEQTKGPAPLAAAPLRRIRGAANADDAGKLTNALSVDVEDYFQVEAFKSVVDRASWDSQPARVADNTVRVLELFGAAHAHATFFVLGWVAKAFPDIVRQIVANGHELASHGFGHENLHSLTPVQFREDVRKAKGILEDISGTPVCGYRAPTFSIGRNNWWAYDILREEGYAYSSSIYPIAHDLYGIPDAPRGPFHPIEGSAFLEIPITTVRWLGRNRPCGGGGYFRLLPYRVSQWSIARVNRVDRMPCVFYCHPWEFDVDQPRIRGASAKSRFRHYLNIRRMPDRVARLLRDFAWERMDRVFLAHAD